MEAKHLTKFCSHCSYYCKDKVITFKIWSTQSVSIAIILETVLIVICSCNISGVLQNIMVYTNLSLWQLSRYYRLTLNQKQHTV